MLGKAKVDVNKLVEGDDSTAIEFGDSLILSQEDADARIDRRSHKERPKAMNVDDHNVVVGEEDSAEEALIRKKMKRSLEFNDITITTPPRSPRINLSSDRMINSRN
uniref:Uncharacterized protein n=1 Tax=Tanacetum cinerariifolium TaxID=118510 RepID=A0A6L2KW40_TANCI|nr:hypothetical protein [Tanacetum cinerariifolium]